VLDGTTFASSFEAWRRAYLDRRDAGKAKDCRIRAKKTVTEVVNAALRLMTDQPPLWSFSCSSFQDSGGRFRVVMADGIWLGFLRRLANKLYKSPCQPCKSVADYVRAGSLCGSESVRRFIRLALKQPAKAVVIKADQLPSAEKALFSLFPAALPANRVAEVNMFEKSKMKALHALLKGVWVLEKAAGDPARSVVQRILYVLTNEVANFRPALRAASDVEMATHVRNWLVGVVGPAAAPGAAGGGGGVGNDSAHSGGSSEDGSPDELDAPPPPPPPPQPAPRGGRGSGGGRGLGGDGWGGRGRGGRGRGGHGRSGRGSAPLVAMRAGREAAAAWRHHEEVTVAEPSDSRCFQLLIKELGPDQYKPVVSLCVALATDAVVNDFKPSNLAGIKGVADDLAAADAAKRVDAVLSAACSPAARPPPLPNGDAAPDPNVVFAAAKARVTHEQRPVMAFILAMRVNGPEFEQPRAPAAAAMRTVCDTVNDYHLHREGDDGSALAFGKEWLDPSLTPEQLLEHFRERFPLASEDPIVTGCFFPGLLQCRPCPFAHGEQPELGMCAKHYQAVRKFFSAWTFTVCCACAHPKLIGFVVLDNREGPHALLNAIITRFALLPYCVVYDFSCGALHSAVGKLPGFVALVVIISDLFHIVNHVYSDIFIPRPYSPLDGKNTVAHEQRNAPIAAMIKTLRACGQDECMRIMKLHTIVHNVHAHARSTRTYPLPDDYNIRQFYFSKQTCLCGCEQQEEEPQLPSPPSSAPSTPTPSSTGMTLSSGSEEEFLNAWAALPAELAVTAASAAASAMRITADVLANV